MGEKREGIRAPAEGASWRAYPQEVPIPSEALDLRTMILEKEAAAFQGLLEEAERVAQELHAEIVENAQQDEGRGGRQG